MFGTMGFSELIIILAIILIIFGAGRLPQIGEGVGKALKGFKKEVHDVPQPPTDHAQQDSQPSQHISASPLPSQTLHPESTQTPSAHAFLRPASGPGPEMTPGTTASLLYNTEPTNPQPIGGVSQQHSQNAGTPTQHVVSMEERAQAPAQTTRAQYPPLPAQTQTKPSAKRPSAIVNKDAVARVQAQQAALKAKAAQSHVDVSPNDMQRVGEGVGDVLRTFRQAVADVRSTVDPEMRTIQAEMDAAQKELQQSLEAAKQEPAVQDDFSKPA